MIPASTMDLARRAMALMESWGDLETFVGPEDDPTCWLEALLHELSHAVEAGVCPFPFTKELSRKVGEAIPEERSVPAEARALATEWLAWGMLGLPWEWEVVVDLADIQGVDEEVLLEAALDPSAKERLPMLIDHVRIGLLGVEWAP